ncbi:MAG: electron transfer flavoprotein subunit beta, partial [Atribacterota bacterium]|nr:electron transfer flavoprotein subunit beta [Atribacterota bacterium]
KEISYPRLPTLRGKQRARFIDIPVYNCKDIGIPGNKLGLKGSPTRVVKIYRPPVVRKGTILKAKDERTLSEAIDRLVSFLEKRKIISF